MSSSVSTVSCLEDTITRQNEEVLKELKPGDLIEFDRGSFDHWGVYIGNEEVVHLTGDFSFSVSGEGGVSKVRRGKFLTIANGSKARINNSKDKKFRPLESWEIIKRAVDMDGQNLPFNLFKLNCEHFASFCRYGKHISEQAEKLLAGIVRAATSFATSSFGSSRR